MMNPEMSQKIQSILERIKDPESDLSVDRLGIVKLVRYNEEKNEMYVFTDFLRHRPGCITCYGVAMTIMATIQKNLAEEFQKEFPNLSIEFV